MGAFSVVGSSMVDTHIGPCLCLDSLVSNHMNSLSKKRDLPRPGSLELSSSFVDSKKFSTKALSRIKSSKKQRKTRSLVIVNEVAGQYEDSFEDVKAVRTESPLNYFQFFYRIFVCKLIIFVLNAIYHSFVFLLA